MAGAGPPHTAEHPEITVKRTQTTHSGHTPATLHQYEDCPECPGVLSPGHVCKPRYAR
jgi:hypothetical protein